MEHHSCSDVALRAAKSLFRKPDIELGPERLLQFRAGFCPAGSVCRALDHVEAGGIDNTTSKTPARTLQEYQAHERHSAFEEFKKWRGGVEDMGSATVMVQAPLCRQRQFTHATLGSMQPPQA